MVKLLAPTEAPSPDGPSIMHFPGGLPSEDKLSNKGSERLRIRLLRNSIAAKAHQLQLAAETSTMNFNANNYAGEGRQLAQAQGRLLMGVYQRSAGSVQLVPVSDVFVMKQSIKEPKQAMQPQPQPEEVQRKKRELVAELGSEKARKSQKRKAAEQVDAQKVYNLGNVAETISAALTANVAEQANAAPLTPQQERPWHPTFVLGARSAAEAYPRDGLVPSAVVPHLNNEFVLQRTRDTAKFKEMGEKKDLWPALTMTLLRAAPPADVEALKPHLYLAFMLRFSKIDKPVLRPFAPDEGGSSKRNEAPSEATALHITQHAWNQLIEDFTEAAPSGKGRAKSSKVRRRSDAMKQKLTLHALALALTLSKGSLFISEAASALALTEERCRFYLRQLGCSMDRGSKAMTLKCPFELPKVEQSRGRPTS